MAWLAHNGRRDSYLSAVAARAQHAGRKIVAAQAFARLAAKDKRMRWRYMSDAADSVELLGHGLFPLRRGGGIAAH